MPNYYVYDMGDSIEMTTEEKKFPKPAMFDDYETACKHMKALQVAKEIELEREQEQEAEDFFVKSQCKPFVITDGNE